MKKSADKVIAIDSHRRGGVEPPQPPQPFDSAANSGNKYTRRSFVAMFLLGRGVWSVAKFHRVKPLTVEAEIRERLVQAGALNDRKAA